MLRPPSSPSANKAVLLTVGGICVHQPTFPTSCASREAVLLGGVQIKSLDNSNISEASPRKTGDKMDLDSLQVTIKTNLYIYKRFVFMVTCNE